MKPLVMAILLIIVGGCLLFAPSFGVIDMMMQRYTESNIRYQAIMNRSPLHAICSVKGCYNPATHQQDYRGYGAAEGGSYDFCDSHWPAPSDGTGLSRKLITNVAGDRIAARIVIGLAYAFTLLMFVLAPKASKITAEEEDEAREAARMQWACLTVALAGIAWIAVLVTA